MRTRALVEEQSEFWPMHYELLAIIAEQQSALLVATLRAYGAKNVGKPIAIPRPTHTELGMLGTGVELAEPSELSDTRVAKEPPSSNVISFSEFAKMLRPGND